MLMLYFSGTGNSKYIAELFSRNMGAKCFSIEEDVDFERHIGKSDTIAFCYPVYMSRVPRILREFVTRYVNALRGKRVIIFCTQLILSGDGARAFMQLIPKGYVRVIYAEHFFMPNNVTNVAILPTAGEGAIQRCAKRAQKKMKKACDNIVLGKVRKRGFNPFSRFLGLFQGVLLNKVEQAANKSVRISDKCTLCGVCEAACPMGNLAVSGNMVTHKQNCTMCYRCVNKCPYGAITIVWHGKVRQAYEWRYMDNE
ncbi:MAG: EFR1 family ferrodoxin [Defluviitaleaceae bacterium]|nr:EFR1 family ferrodoxin [Defluviitaleaceae bacterium]